MRKLVQVLSSEDPQHSAEEIDCKVIAVTRDRPELTMQELLCGERNFSGHIRADGYVGWFDGRGGASQDCVRRICLKMRCSPTTVLANILENTADARRQS